MGSERSCIQHLVSGTSAQSLGLTPTPDQGVLAAHEKTVGWHTPLLARNTWGYHTSTPRARLPRPNPQLSEKHKRSGARRAVGGQGHCVAMYVSEPPWFRHRLGCGGRSGCKSGSQRPRQPGPLHAPPSLLLHQRKGAPSARSTRGCKAPAVPFIRKPLCSQELRGHPARWSRPRTKQSSSVKCSRWVTPVYLSFPTYKMQIMKRGC